MVALLLTTTISCSDSLKILTQLSNTIGLSHQQKIEIVQTLRQFIPSCPFNIVVDERSKHNSRK
jgi:hypothetical protein